MKKLLPNLFWFLLLFFCSNQILYAQGELWGMTTQGGSYGLGVIFKTQGDGSNYSVEYEFSTPNPGSHPVFSHLTEATNGKLYGVTSTGGVKDFGVLFEYDPATNIYTRKLDFLGPNGKTPCGGMTLAPNGKLYGMTTQGGAFGSVGVLYEYDPITGIYTNKFDFGLINLINPRGSLTVGQNGKLYGMTQSGGANFGGVIFEYDISVNALSTKYAFPQGAGPYGGLTQTSNGKWYGMTKGGGTNGILPNGMLFEYDVTTNTFVNKHDFSGGDNGAYPYGSLLLASNGKFYGLTSRTDTYGGLLFEYDPVSNVYLKKADVYQSTGDLIQLPNGKIYGVTANGGANSNGYLFEYDPTSGVIATKVNFPATAGDGSGTTLKSSNSLTLASNGKIYGMHPYAMIPQRSNDYKGAALFEYDATSAVYTKKIDLNFSQGSYPYGGLTEGVNGKLYGVTSYGGAYELGVLFEYDRINKIFTKKIDFDGTAGSRIGSLNGTLLSALNGKLYGVGSGGGLYSNGVLFEYDPVTNTLIKKYDFASADGWLPNGNLMQAANGMIYGLTKFGGSNNQGVIFEYNPSTSTYTKKYDLDGTNGGRPYGRLVQAPNGKLYALTEIGGASGGGVIFEYDYSTNTYTKKIDFSFSQSFGGITLASNGKFYIGRGLLYEYDPSLNTYSQVSSSIAPIGTLIETANNKLYGVTSAGGLNSTGFIFEFDFSSQTSTDKFDFSGFNGQYDANAINTSLLLVKTNQTITFNPLTQKNYGDAAFNLTASATSGLPVSYSSSNTSVATISGNVVTIVGAGSTVITAAQPGDANNFPATAVQQTLIVNKASLTATATNLFKVYGDANPSLVITYTGFKGTDNASAIDITPTITTTALTTSNAGTYPITLSGGLDNSYTLTLVNGTLTVNKAPLTLTADAKTKSYGDANPALTITYSGFKGADNAGVIDVAPTLATTAVTTSNAGTYPITLSGGTDNNYSLSLVGSTLTINKVVLTLTADAKTKTYGDVNPALTITYSGFKGTDNAGVIDVAPTITSTAITTSNAGTYPITLSGGLDDNYILSFVNSTITINKASLTLTADTKTKTYGDVNPTLTFTYSGFKGTDNSSVIDTAPTIATTAVTTSNVGTYPITLSGGTDNNYTLNLVGSTLTINKAALTLTADAKTKTYGDLNPALTISYTGFKGTDNAGVIDTAPTITTTAVTNSNAGTYPITLSGGLDDNYTLSFVSGTLTINKAVLTLTADAKTKTYGDVNPTLTITYSGFKGTDNASVIDTAPTIATTAVTTSNVGTYPITLSGGTDNNYTLTLTGGTLTISKAALTLTADAKTKTYGDVNPALTITYTGFKGTDNASVIDTAPTITTTAITTSNVGTYPITLTGGTDNNYTLSLTGSTLTISKAALTVTADAKTKTYRDVNPVLTTTYTGFKGTDNASVIDTAPTIATTAVAASNAGTYPITLTGGTDNNYTLTLVNGTLTINKAVLTVSADAKTKVYATPNPTLTFTYAGFIGGEDGTVLDLLPTISTSALFNSSPGTYPIIVAGGSDNNYQFAFVNSTLTIYKEEQTILFSALADKNIGDGPFVLFAIGGPSGNPVTFTSSNPAVISILGNVATVVGAGTSVITASQAGSINYNIATSVIQTQTVNLASQTITFNSIVTKKFGDASFNPGATSSSGLAVSYVSSDVNVAIIAGNTIQIVGAGTTTITASQLGNANYNAAANVAQTLTVDPSPLVVTPDHPTICFGTGTMLNATGAASYAWSPATGLSATSGSSVKASPFETTTYTITATYLNGMTATSTAVVKVNAIPLAAGGSHSIIKYCGSCGGSVTSSGLNTSGQLGDGSTTQRISPVALGLTGVTAVAAGTSHSLFLKDDGTVWATGLNTNGQLGNGTTTNKTSPTQVSGLTNIIAISAGNTHSLFLKDDGTVWACGLNTDGQLGDGTTVQKTIPVQIPGLTGIIKISGGGLHSLFLKNDGTVWATGRNANGQLGDGTTVGKTSPVSITTLSGITDLSGGGAFSHFLKSNGTVWATGLNSNGQLGNGTTTQRTTPGALATINYVIAVSGGATHTLFLRNDGTAWSSGLNTNGQLGDGTLTQSTAPVLVSSIVGVSAIDAGATHSLFLINDGTVFVTGRNANGQLGDGTIVSKTSPVQTVNVVPCGRTKAQEQKDAPLAEADIQLLNAYPNPANREATLELFNAVPKATLLTVYDGFGKAVLSGHFNEGETTTIINTADLPAGMYYLKLDTGRPITQKLVVVH